MIKPDVTFEASLTTNFSFQDGTLVDFQDGTDMLLNGGEWMDISADVMNKPVVCSRGIPNNNVLDRTAKSGTLTLYMNNSANNSAGLIGYYSLEHANTRRGWAIDIPIRVKFSHSSYDSGNAKTKFYGRVTNIAPTPGSYGPRSVKVIVKDYMHILNEYDQMPQVDLLQDATTTEAYQQVIDGLSVQPASTSFADGLDTLGYIFHRSGERSGSAFEEFNRLALSSFDYIFVTGDGTLTTQNRETRINKSSLFTLSSDLADFQPDTEKSRLVDRVITVTYPTEVGDSAEIVYENYPHIKLSPGESFSVTMRYTDPNSNRNVGMTDPELIVYRFGTFDNDDSNDLYNDLSVSIAYEAAAAPATFTNNGTKTGYINYIKLQGIILRSFDPVETEKQVNVGRNSTVRVNMPYQNDPDVGNSANLFIGNVYGSNSIQYGGVKMNANRNTTTFANFMDAEIGEPIALTETVTGISAQKVFIQNESWTIRPGRIIEVTYGTARARDENAFTVGTSKVNSTAIIMFAET